MRIPVLLLAMGLIFLALAGAPEPIRAGTPAAPALADSDGDGTPDFLDSCPEEPNIGVVDRDADLVVDHCDLDPDNSGQLMPIQR